MEVSRTAEQGYVHIVGDNAVGKGLVPHTNSWSLVGNSRFKLIHTREWTEGNAEDVELRKFMIVNGSDLA